MNEVKEQIPPESSQVEQTALTAPVGQTPTIWNDSVMMSQGIKMAKMLASSDLVPEQTYKNKPANCLIALDLANRMNFPPLLVMKHFLFGLIRFPASSNFAFSSFADKPPVKFVFL